MSETLSVYKIEREGSDPRFFGSVYPTLAEGWNGVDVTILHWPGGRND